MHLTLKRALKLRKELETFLNRPTVPDNAVISLLAVTGTTEAILTDARKASSDYIKQYVQLSNALATLRLSIATENTKHGVESLLAEIGHIDRCIAVMRKVMAIGQTPAMEILQAEIAHAAKRLDQPVTIQSRYDMPAKELLAPIATPQIHEATFNKLNELRRDREVLEDKRAHLNSQYKIEIAEEDADLLRKLGIL